MPIISMFYGIIIRLYLIDNHTTICRTSTPNTPSSRHPSDSEMARFWSATYHASNCAWCRRG